MELRNKTLLWILSLKSPYGGNIIPSLLRLAERLCSDSQALIIWAFPQQEPKEWLSAIEQKYRVCYIAGGYAERKAEMHRLLQDVKPDIVHTHFGMYDLPVVQAARTLRMPVKVVWHLHCHLNPLNIKGEEVSSLRLLRRVLSYIRVYKGYSRKVFLVAVSSEVAYYADYYRHHWSFLPPPLWALRN